MGCDPDEIFPYTALEEQLKKFGIFAVPMAALLLPILKSDLVDSDLAEESMIDEVRAFCSPLNNPVFVERMRQVIDEVVRLGYL